MFKFNFHTNIVLFHDLTNILKVENLFSGKKTILLCIHKKIFVKIVFIKLYLLKNLFKLSTQCEYNLLTYSNTFQLNWKLYKNK